jgi:CoA binding domain
VVITAPAASVADIIDDAGQLGAAGALIVSAGLGHGTRSLADVAERAAHRYRMRLIGPNCLGMMMPGDALNASFSARRPVAGNLALISDPAPLPRAWSIGRMAKTLQNVGAPAAMLWNANKKPGNRSSAAVWYDCKTQDFGASKLAILLLEPHPNMPKLALSRAEVADLAEYILTLK